MTDSLARGPRKDLKPRIQGAFQGAMLTTTPYGSLTTIALLSSSRIEGTDPGCTLEIRPAQLFSDSKASLKSKSKYGSAYIQSTESRTATRCYQPVEPVSVLQKCHKSSLRRTSSSAAFSSKSLRNPGLVLLHAGNAASAAAMAATASSADAPEDL